MVNKGVSKEKVGYYKSLFSIVKFGFQTPASCMFMVCLDMLVFMCLVFILPQTHEFQGRNSFKGGECKSRDFKPKINYSY